MPKEPSLRLSRAELFALFEQAAPGDPDGLFQQYFQAIPRDSRPFSPVADLKPGVFRPSPLPDGELQQLYGLFDYGLDVANAIMRRVRDRWYDKILEDNRDAVRCVSEGDSWFQHPTITDTIDYLYRRGIAVKSLGAAGDTLQNMWEKPEVLRALTDVRPDFLLWSGGGNDLLGEGFVDFLKRPKAKRRPT